MGDLIGVSYNDFFVVVSIGIGDWIEETGFSSHLDTPYPTTEILLQENFVQIYKLYRITFKVLTEYGADGYTYYVFRANIPPEGGTCESATIIGQAALDEFEIQCNDWRDLDLPLFYQVTLPKVDGTFIFLAEELNNSFALRLPVGDKDDGYRLRLEVLVVDSLEAYTKFNVTVVVSIFQTIHVQFKGYLHKKA